VSITGESDIESFGTIFIPLWLFEIGSANSVVVEYDNSQHNIANCQTFGATLSDIPESAKDMKIVGKSFIKNADGSYTWSAAKAVSVNNTTLKSLN